MKLFTPSDDDLDAILKMKARAEKRAFDSINDYLKNKRLVDGDLKEFEDNAPIASLTGKNTIVVRNAIGQNVRDDTDRLMPMDSRWAVEATEPCIYDTMVDPMTGQEKEVEIDNVHRSYVVRAVSNFISKNTRQSEEAMRAVMDSLTGDNGYILVTSPGTGADESHTAGYPTASEDSTTGGNVGKKIKRGKVLHSAVMPFLPVFLREPPTNIFADPDATTDKEVNCWFRWVCRPLADVKKDKRYEGTKDLKSNYHQTSLRYRSNLNGNTAAPGRNQQDADSEGQPEMLGMWEYHYRVAADPEDSIDGYEYRVMTLVEQGDQPGTSGNSSKPTCIRHEPYAQDIGGFAIKRFQAFVSNDDFYGYSAPIRYSRRANATENAAMSMFTSWVFTNRTRRLWNKNVLSADDVQLIEEGEANDNILLDFKSDLDMTKLVTVIPANPIPPELVQLIQMLRSIANESSGRSANQRGQIVGSGASATEAQIVDQQTKIKMGSIQNRFSRFMEEVQEAGIEILRSLLPKTQANGRKWTIPDPENPGKFLNFDGLDLDARYTLIFDLASMQTDEDSVTVKQGTDLLAIMAKTPPQLLMAAEPLIMQIALALGPVWESRVEKVFENIRRGQEEVANPDKEHILMLQGDPCQPQDEENFASTIPRHEAQAKNVAELPPHEQEAWLRPLGQGPKGPINPLELLVAHIADSRALASAKGINVPGGPAGGAAKAEKGSGPGALRQSQATPTGGDLGGGSGNTVQGSLGRV